MKNHLITFLIVLLGGFPCFGKTEVLSSERPLRFYREEPINMPIYSWPRTLVSYPVVFDGNVQSEHDLSLHDNISGKNVPFQLSKIKKDGHGMIQSAIINFFAELPSGKAYDYTLSMSGSVKETIASPVKIEKNTDYWTLGNDAFMVRIPSGNTHVRECVPAPIIAIGNNKRITGENILIDTNNKVKKIDTEVIEAGDLFAECSVTYTFSSGATYLAKVKVVHGYPFVILDEEISGLTSVDGVRLDLSWKGIDPTHRYGNWDRQKEVSVDGGLPIDKPIYTNWCQEDPHWTGEGWVENPSEKMLYRLLPFAGNSSREQVAAMTFWETNDNPCEIGVFVYDHNRWNDRQYGIWQPTSDLCVYFHYADNILHFTYPLIGGTRSTAIVLSDINKSHDELDAYNAAIGDVAARGGADSPDEMGFRHTMMLHRQYGLLNLDIVKDWVLEYPSDGTHPASPFAKRPGAVSAENFYKQITSSPMAYYMTGLNSFPGIHSISHRPLFGNWVQDYIELYGALTPDQLRTVNGLFLISAYVNTLESMNAIRTSLAGTANMAADGWAVPGQMSFLFPDHPMAKEWADFFEKTIEIYGIFYTRPQVKAYESNAGRWVESLGIYNWAFLRPTSHTNTALIAYDGKNRFADSSMAKRGRWMLDMMTAPVSVKDKDGNVSISRSYPPHGAHGGGRIVPRYCSVRQLADWMKNYDPILAEQLYWTGEMGPGVESKPGNTDWLYPHRAQFADENKGTNPHLKSTKYTGHGIVLRAGVDTDEELSIHLNQVDKGPNYRWGHQGQGNAGGLYFYAKGKIYTGHENEAVGDHMQNNLDGVTNFGVMKNGAFHNIGMNELVAPLYDLGAVQLAELRSVEGKESFAWPEYLSRSVMLVGTDYFLIYDETGTNWRAGARFSWFKNKEDDYPKIVFFGKKARPDHWSKGETNHAHGFYRDADGSLLTLVTHKGDDVDVNNGKTLVPSLMKGEPIYEFVPDDKKYPANVLHIRTPHSADIVFRDGDNIAYATGAETFNGTAGVIRRMNDGELILALMKGRKIEADGFSLELSAPGTAIAFSRYDEANCKGRFKSDGLASLTIKGVKGGNLFIDGIRQKTTDNVALPAGEHAIEYSNRATPMPVNIVDAEYNPSGTMIYLDFPPSTSKAIIEMSADNSVTWEKIGTTDKAIYKLPKTGHGKIHVRAVGLNGNKRADFAQEYPIYNQQGAPHTPDGLKLRLSADTVAMSWGKVLGVRTYRVYRRTAGMSDFVMIYEGDKNEYVDTEAKGTIPPCKMPGELDNRQTANQDCAIYEYRITAVNGFGESQPSSIADTNPASWLNWYPDTDLKFKRNSAFWMPPYVPESEVPEKYYPN